MIRARLIWSILSLFALASCGKRTIGSSTDDSNDDAADGDQTPDAMSEGVPGDPWECGEHGYKCIGPLGIGDCIDGECTGSLYSCRSGDASTEATCAQLCADAGVVCREHACEGATAFGWGVSDPYTNELLCIEADKEFATPLTFGCDDPVPFATYTGVRCCCRYEG